MVPKLIVGLQTLSQKDWSAFRKYVLWHKGENTEVARCFEVLKLKKDSLEEFDSSKWHKKYMPQLSQKAWLNLMSKLYLMLEDWVVYKEMRADSIKSGILLIKYWNRSGKYKLANSKAKQVQAAIDDTIGYSPETDYYQYQLYYYQFFSDNPIKNSDPTLVTKLIRSYLVYNQYKLTLYNSQLKFWRNIKNLDDQEYLMLSKQLTSTGGSPIVRHMLQMIQNDDVDSFHYCFRTIKNSKINPTDDLSVILTMYMLYFAQKLWHMQKLDSPDYLVELYEVALANEVLMKAGKIPEVRYMTMVSVLGSARPFEWTNNFIDTWADKVDTSDVEGLKLFVKASNYFQHGYITESLELLQLMSTKQVNARNYIHTLSIKLYYETREENYDQLMNALERYRTFLWRRKGKIGPGNYKKGQNYLKNIRLLLIEGNQKIKMPQFTPSAETKWLIAKSKNEPGTMS